MIWELIKNGVLEMTPWLRLALKDVHESLLLLSLTLHDENNQDKLLVRGLKMIERSLNSIE